MSLSSLLSNELVVLSLDALLHLASIVVLGVVVMVAPRFLSRGHVDTKFTSGLKIATLLVILRVFLLNNVHLVLSGVDIIVIMALIGLVVFLTTLVLTYKLLTLPWFGAGLSSIVIVAAQFALAHYTPILSLKIMPEGQRFAEYAGVSNEKTKLLMEQAKAFQGKNENNLVRMLKEALGVLTFLSSEEEQESLSRDLASGVNLIQERRAYMASMTEEELAEYRAAMSEFMQEQGIDLDNRYSLSNLKNASPEDLQNLAAFMKDMNKEYGFEEETEGAGQADDAAPPSVDSIRQIAKNLRGIKIEGEGGEKFAALLSEMIQDENFDTEMSKVQSQLAELRQDSAHLMKKLRTSQSDRSENSSFPHTLTPSAADVPELPEFDYKAGRGQKLFTFDGLSPADTVKPAVETGGVQTAGSSTANNENNRDGSAQAVDYYMPVHTFTDFPSPEPDLPAETPEEVGALELPAPEMIEVAAQPPALPAEDTSSYFPDSELSSTLTEDYVLLAPRAPDEHKIWMEVAEKIRVDAWYAGSGGEKSGTLFIEGNVYRAGEKIERLHKGERFHFRFEGVREGQVVITSLKRD